MHTTQGPLKHVPDRMHRTVLQSFVDAESAVDAQGEDLLVDSKSSSRRLMSETISLDAVEADSVAPAAAPVTANATDAATAPKCCPCPAASNSSANGTLAIAPAPAPAPAPPAMMSTTRMLLSLLGEDVYTAARTAPAPAPAAA